MILALNRQQLLSGSKLWLMLLCLLTLNACFAQRKSHGAPKGYDIIEDNTTAPPATGNSASDTIIPVVNAGTTDNTAAFTHKAVYNVALVLPFYLDSFPTIDGGLYPKAQIGIDYYKGALMALDSLQKLGLSVKLHVFDSYPDTYLEILTTGGKLKGMDLIIGPVFNSSMKLMAKYAVASGIPVWSPFSPAADITSKNPYFLMANPRVETHAQKMIEFATDSFSNINLVTLYQFTDQEKRFLEIYKTHIAAFNQKLNASTATFKPQPIVLKEKYIENYGSGLPKISATEIKALLVDGKQNVVLVPSMKIPFILNIIRELYPLSDNYDLTLVGTTTMGNEVDLQLNYLNALKVHYTQSYYINPALYESDFYSVYVAKHHAEPSEYALNGYDQMMFLGSAIKKFGTNFGQQLNNLSFEGWATGYKMSPVYLQPSITDTAVTIDYWDNQHVYILRYNNYTLERAK